MIEVTLQEGDRLDWALKSFKKKVEKSGIAPGAAPPASLREAERYAPAQVGSCAAPRALASQRPLTEAMAKEESVELEGVVSEVLPSTTFRVALDNGHAILATLAGNMRRFRIRVLVGDRVKVEVSPYDLTRGRITFRHKN